jgi:DNA polymerase III gamma/tau subunit
MSASALLLETARRGELHHSIILHGPAAGTLRDLAMRMAKALNCLGDPPHGPCASCGKIDRGTHPDVHLLAVDEGKKMISAEQIRAMVGEAALRPYEGRFKVFVIDGAETVSGAGANAMLKTLEEPSAATVFILLARSADLLLPTIRSRSQAIAIRPAALHPAGPAQQARLAGAAADLPNADAAWAEEAGREVIRAVARFATQRDSATLIALAAGALHDADPAAALPLLALVLKDLAAIDPEDSIEPDAVRAIQSALDRETLLDAAAIALRNATRLAVNADSRLLIEQALVRIARTQ